MELQDASTAIQQSVWLLANLRNNMPVVDPLGKQAADCYTKLVDRWAETFPLMKGIEPQFRAAYGQSQKCCGLSAPSFHELAMMVVGRHLTATWNAMIHSMPALDAARVLKSVGNGADGYRQLTDDIAAHWPEIYAAIHAEPFAELDCMALLSDVQAELAKVAAAETGNGQDNGGTSDPVDDPTTDEKAAALAAIHPEWSNEQIAAAVPCHVKTLNKPNMEKYKAVRKAAKSLRDEYRDTSVPGRAADRRRRPSNINHFDPDE